MTIVFNYEIFALQSHGGISRYYLELADQLKKTNHYVKILAPYHINEYLSPKHKDIFFSCDNKRIIKNRFYDFSKRTNFIYTERYLNKKNVEILHQTYFTDNPTKNNKVKKVITIHDMIPELFPEDFPDIEYIISCKKKYIYAADLIICVSENTKKDLIRLYPEVKEKIVVIYHGVNLKLFSNKSAYKYSLPYILYVGKRGGYKNFSMLLKIYCETKELNKKYNLLCFGGGKFNNYELTEIENHELKNKIIQLDGDDYLLSSLYQSASLFVYPSSYEGFGMPVLEAMALGCPVVCSNASSLPEVAGSAAVFFNKDDKYDMKRAIVGILNNNELRKNIISKGFERVGKFTWERCAEETMKAYQTLLNN